MHWHSGITLLELIVSISIMSLVILVVVNIFIGTSRFNTDEQSRILVGDEATRVFSTLDQTLRQGKAIVASAIINGTTYTTNGTTVVLTLPSIVAGSPSPTQTDIAVVRWDSSSEQIQLITAPDPSSSRAAGTAILTDGVSDIYFRYTSDDPTVSTTVEATIITSAPVNNSSFRQTAVLYVPLRNHS